ncbi:MAG: N-acetylglucosamine kinase [Sphingobacteriales bacterium]|jgi:glucosamine kinase|nr:MAG: N-acetylglucosamine kinase [Sphingobacteriales bacterium]
MAILIADSGATKCEWCLINNGRKKIVFTQGISPYFLDSEGVQTIVLKELLPSIKKYAIDAVYYYGTGCGNPANVKMIKGALKKIFAGAVVAVESDLTAAARALCGHKKGIACILGTGSNSCFYNGKKIVKNSPGLGYVLGDEGSGAYLGKKVIQYYLYGTFDEDLRYKFNDQYKTDTVDILENVYRKPLANRYLATYSLFLAENRGHYMVENIIEDGLNDFFFTHLCKYSESWKYPINFVGSVAWGFRDVITELCNGYEFEMGRILKNPMEGLIDYHC